MLTTWGFIRKYTFAQLKNLTEFAVNNFFTFRVGNYRVTYLDSASRLYNLYRSGQYLTDQGQYIKYLTGPAEKVEKVQLFLKRSKTPFRLEYLCRQVVKYQIGPKHHFYKIKHLHHSGHLTLNMAEYLARYDFTYEGSLVPEHRWEIPPARGSGSLRNDPMGRGLPQIY